MTHLWVKCNEQDLINKTCFYVHTVREIMATIMSFIFLAVLWQHEGAASLVAMTLLARSEKFLAAVKLSPSFCWANYSERDIYVVTNVRRLSLATIPSWTFVCFSSARKEKRDFRIRCVRISRVSTEKLALSPCFYGNMSANKVFGTFATDWHFLKTNANVNSEF